MEISVNPGKVLISFKYILIFTQEKINSGKTAAISQ